MEKGSKFYTFSLESSYTHFVFESSREVFTAVAKSLLITDDEKSFWERIFWPLLGKILGILIKNCRRREKPKNTFLSISVTIACLIRWQTSYELRIAKSLLNSYTVHVLLWNYQLLFKFHWQLWLTCKVSPKMEMRPKSEKKLAKNSKKKFSPLRDMSPTPNTRDQSRMLGGEDRVDFISEEETSIFNNATTIPDFGGLETFLAKVAFHSCQEGHKLCSFGRCFRPQQIFFKTLSVL